MNRPAILTAAGGLLAAALLAFVPYTPDDAGTGLRVRCGPPALGWRTKADVENLRPGEAYAGEGGAAVEEHLVCASGITQRLGIALVVLAGTVVAVTVTGTRTERR